MEIKVGTKTYSNVRDAMKDSAVITLEKRIKADVLLISALNSDDSEIESKEFDEKWYN